MAELLQFAFSGLTVGAIYALVALGFTLIYNASDIINFAQGEFVMLGGMTTVFMAMAGIPLPLAALIAIAVTTGVGLAQPKGGKPIRINMAGIRMVPNGSMCTMGLSETRPNIFAVGSPRRLAIQACADS